MYIYRSHPCDISQWAVGFYDPTGAWIEESLWSTSEEAAGRVHWLNGGDPVD